MDATTIIWLINGLIKAAFTIWASARKVLGKEAIPEWSEIMNKNVALQAEIDAELENAPTPEDSGP